MDILQMSLSASLLLLPLICVRLFWRGRLPKNSMQILWGIVCCKLMMPANLFLPMKRAAARVLPAICSQRMADSAADAGVLAGAEWLDLPDIPIGFYIPAQEMCRKISALPVVWLAGAVCLAIYFAAAYRHCIHIFSMSLPADGLCITQYCESRFPGRRVRIRVSDRIASPMTFGVIHPVILLPAGMDRNHTESLHYVLEHEMAHVKRWDSMRKIFLAAVLICHWFNPMVWVMYILINRDIELECDELVLCRAGSNGRADYARVLIEWEAARPAFHLLASHLIQNCMEERIRNIMNRRKVTLTGIALSVMLVSSAMAVYAMTPPAEDAGGAAPQDAYAAKIANMALQKGTADTVEPVEEATEETDKMQFPDYVEDPTLGGIFETYTVEEYEKEVAFVKKYADGDDGTGSGCRAMEEALEKLKADNGKGEFVIYKAAFEKTWEEDGYFVSRGFNPICVMAPELEYQSAGIPLTAERYRKDMEGVKTVLDEAVADGQLTPENREIILAKMDDNLAKMQ